MKKKRINCSYCFLGNGYTANIGYFLKNEDKNSIILERISNNSILELEIEKKLISPIPIFPVKNDRLYNKLNFSLLNGVSKLEVLHKFKEENIVLQNFSEQSFLKFLVSNDYSKNWVNVSLKQWGGKMLIKKFSEVRKKISRQYGKKSNERVGYYNGLSLYYHFLKNAKPPRKITYKEIININVKSKFIETSTHIIYYKKLISTVPLPKFLKILKLKTKQDFSSQGAYFFYYKFKGYLHENKIYYDCRYNSKILRVFSVSPEILMVQLVAYKRNEINLTSVNNGVLELCPEITDLKYLKRLFIAECYPLESITDKKLIEYKKYLLHNGILTFGRLGNWEYKDLHELNWDLL